MIKLLIEGFKARTALREAGIEPKQINLSATTLKSTSADV